MTSYILPDRTPRGQDTPQFASIEPEMRTYQHGGETYTVEVWTPRDLRLYTPDGAYIGKFRDMPSICRYLTYAEVH